MSETENIYVSGIVVHARPENLSAVQSDLNLLPGVEVHATTGDGRIVVTVEKDDSAGMADAFVQIQNLKHVINASLVYQHSESIDGSEAEMNS